MAEAGRVEGRREQLLAAALTVFAARGYASASIKDVAEAAGVAPSLIYHYFASKDELLAEVVEHHSLLPELRRIVAVSADRPAREVLTEVGLRLAALLGERHELFRLLMQEAHTQPAVGQAWGRVVASGSALLSRYLQSRVEAGELRPHETEVAAQALLGWVVLRHLLGDRPAERVPVLVEVLLSGCERGKERRR